ncbi:sigma-54 interaction domain-containing protein [Hippea alviniae]|uniref:sigma-54 interaction domain-containing protein n=1 Tax=Hippea alviniae TaxID=1279027 RepID=UPI0003B72153|nr:sigma 54-interacting transcriptional regulator [Hippea alviniae]
MDKVSKQCLSFPVELADIITDNLYVGVYVTDSDGYTIYINKVYEEMSQLPREKLLGKNMKELVENNYFSASATLLVLKTRKPAVTTFTTRTNRTLLSHGKPVFDKKGNMTFVVNTVYDISEFDKYIAYFETDHNFKERSSPGIIAHSPKMMEIVELAIRISKIDSTVLITGESGVGKEILARLIHSLSKRKNRPFIKVNCAAIPNNLIESELFGYKGGAFTGSNPKGKKGIFEEANNSTIFLDEIGEIPLDVQTKLLQVLQDKEFTKLGSVKPTKVNVRIIAATNKNLEEMIKKNLFREDLYYRLNVIPIHIPPLRERKEDIEPLTKYITDRLNKKYGLNKRISKDLIKLFQNLQWKGNVRELENYIERLMILTKSNTITRNDYYSLLKTKQLNIQLDYKKDKCQKDLKIMLHECEEKILKETALNCKNIQEFAKKLNISKSTAARKAKKFKIKFQK